MSEAPKTKAEATTAKNANSAAADAPAIIVHSDEELSDKLVQMREAQKKFATYTQEQVDKIFYAAALAANAQRIPLAKMAVEETGMGIMEDKVIKNHYAAEFVYNKYKDTQTCGILEQDLAGGMTKVAEPIGVVAAVIPTTNPTSTAIFKALLCLKTRNAMMISPHPPSSAGSRTPRSSPPRPSWPRLTSSSPPVAPAWSPPPTAPAPPPSASARATTPRSSTTPPTS